MLLPERCNLVDVKLGKVHELQVYCINGKAVVFYNVGRYRLSYDKSL